MTNSDEQESVQKAVTAAFSMVTNLSMQDIINPKKCKLCNEPITVRDKWIIGKEFVDMDLGLCSECVISTLKDILEYEEEKERWQQQQQQRQQQRERQHYV